MEPNGVIVLPLDGSKNAENAVPTAARLAETFNAKVRVVHVLDENAAQDAAAVAAAKARFEEYARDLAQRHGLDRNGLEIEVRTGPAGAGVLAAARGASCITIASHGRSGLKATMVGSVADKVVRGSPVPVFFVPGLGPAVVPGAGPVLVAVDGSPEAEQGLAIGRDVAKAFGAKVTLVRAYTLPPPVGVEFGYYQPDLITSLKEGAEEYLAATAKEGERSLVVLGGAAAAIDQVANDIDAGLVVMTSHGKGFVERIALGSTTDRVMHSLRRPLLIVPVREAS